jgi:hypothetical protein
MSDHAFNQLTESISALTRTLCELLELKKHEFCWLKSQQQLVTKSDLKETEQKIMSAISDFAAKQTAFNDRVDVAITDLQGDVQTLNDTIAQLQSSPGAITPEDQALLDGLQTRAESITTKLEALDALTPPKPPTA